MYVDGVRLFTIERPWLHNERYVSCIPEGQYRLRKRWFHRGGYNTYEIVDVPGRSAILIHHGNTSDDVMGCIALGMDLGVVRGKWAVIRSRQAFRLFMDNNIYTSIEIGMCPGTAPSVGGSSQ